MKGGPEALDLSSRDIEQPSDPTEDCEASSETCDGIDNDCDGTIDEDDSIDARTWHLDADADGFGTVEGAVRACTAPPDHVEARPEGMDCNDDDASIHPGAAEEDCADPIDYNCDGSVAYQDLDGDGVPACQDCDDTDASIHPLSDELCDNRDNDCDGAIDEDDATDATPWYVDLDGDGFGADAGPTLSCHAPEGHAPARSEGFDCDDTDPGRNPGATEEDCADPIDYNCDGSVVFRDRDEDGWAACKDCDDLDAKVHPDAVEVCDLLDNDCDDAIDDTDEDLDLSTATQWFLDSDLDGYGIEDESAIACTPPPDHVAAHADGFDCDDADGSVFPDSHGFCNPGSTLALRLSEQQSLLLPMSVALSPESRRAFVVSLSTPYVAEVDIDLREVKTIHHLGDDFASGLPRLDLDGNGTVWISNRQVSHPAMRLEPSTGRVTPVEAGLSRTYDVLGMPGGGALFVGADIDENTVIWRVDSGGCRIASRTFSEALAATVADAPDGYAVMLNQPGGLSRVLVVDGNLEDVRECTGMPGGDFILARADGSILVSTNEVLYESDCEEEAVPILYGIDNHELVEAGEEIILLDRRGSEEVAGENWGQAQRLYPNLDLAGSPFQTGKHSGFGSYDPVDGLIWVSSEGTAEILGYDPRSGHLEARVQLGVHAAEVAAHPSMPNSIWVTGRLSQTLMRWNLATQHVAARTAAVTWPLSPVFADYLLFVVDGMSSVVYGLDPTTLEVVRTLDAGLSSNVTLMLHSLAYHPGRNSLFLAHGEANELYEIDAISGEVLNEWALPGELVEDSSTIGRLRVVVHSDHVFVARSTDGWISHFDLSDPEISHHELLSIEDLLLVSDLRWGSLVMRGRWLYYGGLALSTTDLARVPEEDLPVDLLIGSIDGEWVGWDMELNSLVFMDEEGETIETIEVTYEGDGAPGFTLTHFDGRGVAYVGFGDEYLRHMKR